MQYVSVPAEKAAREIIPGYFGRFVHTDQMTLAFWEVRSGSTFPAHAHSNEQVAMVQEGIFQLTIEGETLLLEKGMVAVIPSNAVHSGIAVTDCRLLDVFHPVREDYLL